MPVGKYVFVIFLSRFVIRNFRGTCSSSEMLQWYIASVSLGTPDLYSSDLNLKVERSFCE